MTTQNICGHMTRPALFESKWDNRCWQPDIHTAHNNNRNGWNANKTKYETILFIFD